jgi:ATP-dependent RNA helicase RhlE
MGFKELNLMDPVLRSLAHSGYTTPTPIQERVVPLAIKGLNVTLALFASLTSKIVASAETGTGKTAAYVLPMLHRAYILLKRERAMGID